MALNSLYSIENQLQAINHTADAIERDSGISVLRCHLGNPTGPQFEGTNQMLSEYFAKRSSDPASRGYADVVGNEQARLGIARALEKINRLPKNTLSQDNIIGVTGGTGALNIALSIFGERENEAQPVILVSDPFYPPWKSIAARVSCEIKTYSLLTEQDFLPDLTLLDQQISGIVASSSEISIILIYHYPHNPTGKTLHELEAQQLSEMLNLLCAKYPQLYLIQEDLYLATTAPHLGIYTPLTYLNPSTRKRIIWLHSPSKMGHQQDRAAVLAAFDPELLKHLRGATSFDILGTSVPALMATANTLMHIAQGGVNSIDSPDSISNNHRFVTAHYYQERLCLVHLGIREIEQHLQCTLIQTNVPEGGYYLFPSFEILKGQPLPKELLPVFNGKQIFENADDLSQALANAHLLGLRPVTVASGILFTGDSGTMNVRISTVEPIIDDLRDGVNTIKGLVEKTLSINLGASFYSSQELKNNYPVALKNKRSKPPFRWMRKPDGSGREWALNP